MSKCRCGEVRLRGKLKSKRLLKEMSCKECCVGSTFD